MIVETSFNNIAQGVFVFLFTSAVRNVCVGVFITTLGLKRPLLQGFGEEAKFIAQVKNKISQQIR